MRDTGIFWAGVIALSSIAGVDLLILSLESWPL